MKRKFKPNNNDSGPPVKMTFESHSQSQETEQESSAISVLEAVPHVLEQIFLQLEPRDFKNVMTVKRSWKAFVETNILDRFSVLQRDIVHPNLQDCLAMRWIEGQIIQGTYDRDLFNKVLKRTTKRGRFRRVHMKFVPVYQVSQKDIAKVVPDLPRLRVLKEVNNDLAVWRLEVKWTKPNRSKVIHIEDQVVQCRQCRLGEWRVNAISPSRALLNLSMTCDTDRPPHRSSMTFRLLNLETEELELNMCPINMACFLINQGLISRNYLFLGETEHFWYDRRDSLEGTIKVYDLRQKEFVCQDTSLKEVD